jgi:hypothetical protein
MCALAHDPVKSAPISILYNDDKNQVGDDNTCKFELPSSQPLAREVGQIIT